MKNKEGFTLIEVMIALVAFGLFATAYVTSEGRLLMESFYAQEENILHRLCENKLNEVMLDPPRLDHDAALIPVTGNFDEQGFPDYEYTVTFKELTIPNLAQLQGKSGSGGDEEGESGENGGTKSGSEKSDLTSLSEASGESPGDQTSSGSSGGLGGGKGGGGSGSRYEKSGQNMNLEEKVFNVLKENIQKMLWQIEVSTNKKGSQSKYILSGLIKNAEAKVEIKLQ